MKNYKIYLMVFSFCGLFSINNTFATNPIIMDQFTADPTARVFEGRIYLYPSHDMPGRPGDWFAMEDYHVFSSENLTDWTEHGVICDQTNVPWLNRKGYDMWAPDCVFKNGTYYFYFPVGRRIGVATSDKPYGSWKVLDKPVTGAGGIDPCVLIDDDGSSYLFTGAQGITVAKLKDDMIELESRSQRIANLPRPGLIEGPFAFKRNGIYYLTYPHAVTDAAGRQGSEELEYSISTNVFGPYKWMGVITDTNKSGCWTEHHSIVQYKGQWYLFYHDKQLSPNFDRNRSVRIDYLYFNDDGSIKKVIPTLRGVGIADATSKIQIDRYSDISEAGVSTSFINTNNTFEGWKISLNGKNTWVKFDRVDFGKRSFFGRLFGLHNLKSVNIRAQSATGGVVEIRADKVDGPVLARVEIGKGADWQVVNAKATGAPSGVHDLVVTHNEDHNVDLDWISFQ
jgi:beta-xylosidase